MLTNILTYLYLRYYDYRLRTDRRFMLKELIESMRQNANAAEKRLTRKLIKRG